jgi:protein transport protein SEC24
VQPQQPQQQGVQMRLNPLQPVDVSMQGQPFHVSDLDQAPPPIILPPNVSGRVMQRRVGIVY